MVHKGLEASNGLLQAGTMLEQALGWQFPSQVCFTAFVVLSTSAGLA